MGIKQWGRRKKIGVASTAVVAALIKRKDSNMRSDEDCEPEDEGIDISLDDRFVEIVGNYLSYAILSGLVVIGAALALSLPIMTSLVMLAVGIPLVAIGISIFIRFRRLVRTTEEASSSPDTHYEY